MTKIMLDAKLQLKSEQTLGFLNNSLKLPTRAKQVSKEVCDVLIIFVITQTDLKKQNKFLLSAAKKGKIVWIAYPKANQLNADINRDSIHRGMETLGLKTVRQISINEIWS